MNYKKLGSRIQTILNGIKRPLSVASRELNINYDILENCINDLDPTNEKTAVDLVFEDDDLTDILYNMIVYGNLKSRTNKSLTMHSRINSFDESDKHQMAIEVEKYQRLNSYLDKVIFTCLFCSIGSLIYYYI